MEKIENRKCLLILGMHRSGTSMLAGLLRILGINFGDNLLGPNFSNELGHFEHIDILDINREILKFFNSNWDDVNDLPENWHKSPDIKIFKDRIKEVIIRDFPQGFFGIKEPRISILLPLYIDIFSEMGIEPIFAIILRREIEILKSLSVKNNIYFGKSLALCERYRNNIEKFTENKKRVYLSFDDLINYPRYSIEKIKDTLDVKLRDYNEFEKDIIKFIDPRLKHHNLDCFSFLKELAAQVEEREKIISGRDEEIKEKNLQISEYVNSAIAKDNIIKQNSQIISSTLLSLSEKERHLEEFKILKEKQFLALKSEKEKEINQLKINLFHERGRISAIERSLTFKLLRLYQKLIDFILPEGLLVRNFYDNIIRFNQTAINKNHSKELARVNVDPGKILEKLKNPEILFVNHEESRTGAPRIFFDVVKACKDKYKIAVLSKEKGTMHEEFVNTFIDIIYPNEIYPEPARFEKARKIIARLKPKLVYVNSLVGYEYAMEAKKMDIPVIFHVHELASAFDKIMSFADRRDFSTFADVFIAVSKEVHDYLIEEIKCDPNKVKTFHEFIDIERVFELAKEKSDKNLKKEGEILLLGCGTFCKRKGVDIFYEAMKKIKLAGLSCKAVWIGENIRHYYDLVEKIKKEDLGNFILLGEKENPFPYIKQADIFVLPSREDPFPLVVLEAMALGKPIITFAENIGSKEAVDENCGIVVEKTDSDALAESIKTAVENINVFKEKAQKFSSEKIKEEYDINIILPKITKLISNYAKSGEKKEEDFLYIFLHMPKCAGSTFLMHISNSLKENEWLWLFRGKEFGSNNFESNKDMDDYIGSLSDEQKSKIKVIAGHHVFYGVHKFFNKTPRYITFLREPVERTISHYNFCRTCIDSDPPRVANPSASTANGEIISFEEWFEKNDVLHDYMVRFILEEFLRKPLSKISESDFNEVKNTLANFYFVGMTKDFDKYTPNIYSKIGVKNFEGRDNISQKYFEPDKRVKRIISEKLFFDKRLYEFILQNQKIFEKNLE